jgi:hypothetical protein
MHVIYRVEWNSAKIAGCGRRMAGTDCYWLPCGWVVAWKIAMTAGIGLRIAGTD